MVRARHTLAESIPTLGGGQLRGVYQSKASTAGHAWGGDRRPFRARPRHGWHAGDALLRRVARPGRETSEAHPKRGDGKLEIWNAGRGT